MATLRATARGDGRPLTQLNALALAGQWYSWFLGRHENDTRLPSYWEELRDYLVWDVIGREATDEYKADTDADPHWEWAKAPEVRDAVRPVIAELARVATFLSSAGFPLDENAYRLFTNAVSDLLFGAFVVLERRANGDFTPDETPKQFPLLNDAPAVRGDGLSCWALFEGWVKSAKRAGSSVRRARGVFIELEAKFPRTSAEPEALQGTWGLQGLGCVHPRCLGSGDPEGSQGLSRLQQMASIGAGVSEPSWPPRIARVRRLMAHRCPSAMSRVRGAHGAQEVSGMAVSAVGDLVTLRVEPTMPMTA